MRQIKIMEEYLDALESNDKLTEFVRFIKNNDKIQKHNYIFRKFSYQNKLTIDIYDNISENCFNRYVFSFAKNEISDILVDESSNVFSHYIPVYKIVDPSENFSKFGYMFSLTDEKMIEYSNELLGKNLTKYLKEIIK